MDHESDVWLVDSHTERRRGHHHVDIAGHELLLDVLTYPLCEARMVRGRPHASHLQLIGVLFRGLPGSYVDDAPPGRRGDRLQDLFLLIRLVETAENRQVDVLPSGAPYHDDRIMQLQPFEDVGTKRRSCGWRQRDAPSGVQG